MWIVNDVLVLFFHASLSGRTYWMMERDPDTVRLWLPWYYKMGQILENWGLWKTKVNATNSHVSKGKEMKRWCNNNIGSYCVNITAEKLGAKWLESTTIKLLFSVYYTIIVIQLLFTDFYCDVPVWDAKIMVHLTTKKHSWGQICQFIVTKYFFLKSWQSNLTQSTMPVSLVDQN